MQCLLQLAALPSLKLTYQYLHGRQLPPFFLQSLNYLTIYVSQTLRFEVKELKACVPCFFRISICHLISADVFVAALVDLAAFSAFDITSESELIALSELLS